MAESCDGGQTDCSGVVVVVVVVVELVGVVVLMLMVVVKREGESPMSQS
jgi:hypothetical protein